MAIVKVLTRRSPSFGSLLRYITQYIGDKNNAENRPIYTQNLRSNDIEGWIGEFIANEALRKSYRANQIAMYHEIVSFSSEENRDAFTQDKIDDLVGEYMRLRGETGVMFGSVHQDREHIHFHFCVSALHYRTGKSFGLNKAQLLDLKTKFQEYHRNKYPELSKSLPEHGKGNRRGSPSKWHMLRREEIAEKVKQCYELATSQEKFLNLLRDEGFHHYERANKPIGIMYEGQKFRFSRLLDQRQLEDLPEDRSEADKALEEIRAIRERHYVQDEKEVDWKEIER